MTGYSYCIQRHDARAHSHGKLLVAAGPCGMTALVAVCCPMIACCIRPFNRMGAAMPMMLYHMKCCQCSAAQVLYSPHNLLLSHALLFTIRLSNKTTTKATQGACFCHGCLMRRPTSHALCAFAHNVLPFAHPLLPCQKLWTDCLCQSCKSSGNHACIHRTHAFSSCNEGLAVLG